MQFFFLLLIEKWIYSLGCCRTAQTTCNSHADRFYISICIYLVSLETMHRYAIIRNLSCQSNIYRSWSTLVRLVPSNIFQPSSKFLTGVTRLYFFCGPFLLRVFVFHNCLFHTVSSVPCNLVVRYRKRTGWLLVSCMWCFLAALTLSHMVSLDSFAAWSVSIPGRWLLAYFSLNFISFV